MAAMDFPNSPSVGELFGSLGTVWRWDGARWVSTSGPSGSRGLVKNLAMPVGPIAVSSGGSSTIVTAQNVSFIAGRTYKITFTSRAVSASPAGYSNTRVLIAGVQHGTDYWHNQPGNNGSIAVSILYTPPTTLDRTVGISVAGVGAALTIYTDTPSSMCIVEDITYEAGTAGNAGPWPLGRIGYAERLSNITGLTTLVTLTDLSFSASLIGGRAYRLSCEMYVNSTVSTDRIGLEIRRNAVQIQSVQANGIASWDTKAFASLVYRPTVNETSTFAVFGGRIGGTGTVSVVAGATFPAYLLLEDIGLA